MIFNPKCFIEWFYSIPQKKMNYLAPHVMTHSLSAYALSQTPAGPDQYIWLSTRGPSHSQRSSLEIKEWELSLIYALSAVVPWQPLLQEAEWKTIWRQSTGAWKNADQRADQESRLKVNRPEPWGNMWCFVWIWTLSPSSQSSSRNHRGSLGFRLRSLLLRWGHESASQVGCCPCTA